MTFLKFWSFKKSNEIYHFNRIRKTSFIEVNYIYLKIKFKDKHDIILKLFFVTKKYNFSEIIFPQSYKYF